MKRIAAAIIVAAGRGERFGAPDKVFSDLAGKPMVAWSLDAFNSAQSIGEIILVAGEHTLALAQKLQGSDTWPKLRKVVVGGDRRQDSVLLGMQQVGSECSIVAIHDGARPLIETEAIDRCIATAALQGSAILATRVADTIKQSDGGMQIIRTVSRDSLWAAQTPQAFDRSALERAFVRCQNENWTVTDDASMIERAGGTVTLVPGSSHNMKVTTREDAMLAEQMLAARSTARTQMIRTGIGYDAHRFVEGRKLVLGGVEIPANRGLEGHSDADVLLHAVTDALLGAGARGDIGTHFPPGDPLWRDASSLLFLQEAARLIREDGNEIRNIDATIIAEAPRIMPHADRMRENIARVAGVTLSQVSIKATTNEGMGFVGREEGMAALAIATISAPDQ